MTIDEKIARVVAAGVPIEYSYRRTGITGISEWVETRVARTVEEIRTALIIAPESALLALKWAARSLPSADWIDLQHLIDEVK